MGSPGDTLSVSVADLNGDRPTHHHNMLRGSNAVPCWLVD